MIRQLDFAAIRKRGFGEEWIYVDEIGITKESVIQLVAKNDVSAPEWAEKYPFVRIAEVEITEVQQ